MSITRFRVLLAREIAEQARSYRLVAVLAVFAFFGLGSPLLAKLPPEILRMVGPVEGARFRPRLRGARAPPRPPRSPSRAQGTGVRTGARARPCGPP